MTALRDADRYSVLPVLWFPPHGLPLRWTQQLALFDFRKSSLNDQYPGKQIQYVKKYFTQRETNLNKMLSKYTEWS